MGKKIERDLHFDTRNTIKKPLSYQMRDATYLQASVQRRHTRFYEEQQNWAVQKVTV